jgi:hypothetical protein
MAGQSQHYVPQFYLRNFAKKRRRRFYLSSYHKPDRKQFTSNVSNLAQETSFYDIPEDPSQGAEVEEFLRNGEPRWADAIQKALRDTASIRVPAVRTTLSEFAATLMSRTPSLRTHLRQISSEGSRKLLQQGAHLPEFPPDEVKRVQASLLIETTALYSSILANMATFVVINTTGTPFWTSDNPLTKYNPQKDDFQGTLGLLSKGIQLFIPLSPAMVLGFVDPDAYRGLPPLVEATQDVVTFCNSSQVVWSLEYLFSREEDFALADAFLSEHPLYADPHRPRVVAS